MKKIIVLWAIFTIACFATNVNHDKTRVAPICTSQIFITSAPLDLNAVRKTQHFRDFKDEHINLGFTQTKRVWVKLYCVNTTTKTLKPIIKINNPLLEHVVFYDSSDGYRPHERGMLHITPSQKYIYPYYHFHLAPKQHKEIYIKIQNTTTALQFGIHMMDRKTVEQQEWNEQVSIIFLSGVLGAFLLYSLTLFFYTKNVSYLLYATYLFFLLFQQLTFIGFLPLYTSESFTYIDNLIVVPKVSLMIIAAAMFAKNFLKTKAFPIIHKIYNYIILFLIIQMPFFGTPWFYVPEVSVVTGFVFVIFNTFCGFYVYRHGNKQARFFIIGWIFLIIGYLVMIFDALGLFSLMHHFPELILWLTVFEALFLLLAFVDKIHILSMQKKVLNQKLFEEMSNRNSFIKKEVKQKTKDLQGALQDKSILLKELHHRVKNNLQLILSITRLQRYNIKDEPAIEQFCKLEARVSSIARSHEMLCSTDEMEYIDMNSYMRELCEEIKESFMTQSIKISYHIDTRLPINKAVYVGLVINELVLNSLKYAFDDNKGEIEISLEEKGDQYMLKIFDNGKGFDNSMTEDKTLGLKLVDSLVVRQLHGTIDVVSQNHTHYTICFPR
ncbi:7TM diverse intracellular signaling domain-containing protein [Sulfurospirillum sp. 1612]|uniref:7TM diverse intracellular signaling domain-containing protein n=1 Tax=Sulfurospirillum sp. 1612 TaxID=3094835 RepID=UPI002F92C095